MSHLPPELWLQILAHLPPDDLWLSVRPISHQLASYAEDTLTNPTGNIPSPLSKFTIGLSFSLGGGTQHRWYDVRGTITFTFKELSKERRGGAWFGSCIVHPQTCYKRAMEHWARMVRGNPGMKGQEWRVQYGYEGEVRVVRLPGLVVAEGEGIRCNWREVFDAYFGGARGGRP